MPGGCTLLAHQGTADRPSAELQNLPTTIDEHHSDIVLSFKCSATWFPVRRDSVPDSWRNRPQATGISPYEGRAATP